MRDTERAASSAPGRSPAAADPAGSRRRADDLPPPGQRNGQGIASLLPYLALTLASKPASGPPGGIERRARPRR